MKYHELQAAANKDRKRVGRGIAAGNFGGEWVYSMVFYAPRPSSCSNTVSNECSGAEFLVSQDAEMSRLYSSGLT